MQIRPDRDGPTGLGGDIMRLRDAAPRAALVATFVLGLAAVPASAEFGRPDRISGRGEARQAHVAVDTAGNALIVWRQADGANFRIESRRRAANGALGAVEKLSRAGQKSDAVQIGMSSAGDALVIWSTGVIQARARSAAGTLGRIENVSKINGNSAQLAVNSDGDAVVVWRTFVEAAGIDQIQARARSSAGVLGPILKLSDHRQTASDPKVAINAAGDAIVAWRHYDGAHWRIQARAVFAGGTLGAVRTLSKRTEDAQGPQVMLDADGNVLTVWGTPNGRILASHGTLSGGFAGVEIVAQGDPSFPPQFPVAGMDAAGNALIVWSRAQQDLGGAPLIEARSRSAAGKYSAVETLSTTRGGSPVVAVQPSGTAVVAWVRYNGTVTLIEARRRFGGTFEPVQVISNPAHDSDAPNVRIGGNGEAIAVWERQDAPGNVRTEAAQGP